jgi:hypothetical protein
MSCQASGPTPTHGTTAATIAAFAEDLRAHNGDAKNITSVTIDISPAFINGVTDNLPNARITFDKFHVIATRWSRKLPHPQPHGSWCFGQLWSSRSPAPRSPFPPVAHR